MAYIFRDANNNDISHLLNSYWIFVNFSLNNLAQIQIHNGFFAVYFSQVSSQPMPGPLSFCNDARRPLVANYCITDNIHSLQLNNAQLIRSQKTHYCNEIAQLHLFEFRPQIVPAQWLNDASYNQPFLAPTSNQNGAEFLDRKVSFGDFTDRYAYHFASQENLTGLNTLCITLPFLKPSFLSQILARGLVTAAGNFIPQLTLKHGFNDAGESGQEWNFFVPAALAIPAIGCNGFVMVTQGTFKTIELDAELGKWLNYNVAQDVTTQDKAIYALSQLIARSTKFVRTAANVTQSGVNSVYAVEPDLPVELVYLTGLGATTPLL